MTKDGPSPADGNKLEAVLRRSAELSRKAKELIEETKRLTARMEKPPNLPAPADDTVISEPC